MTPRTRTPQILWAALFVSTILLGAVAFIMKQPPQPPQAIMLPAIAGVAFTTVVISFVLPRQLMTKGLTATLTPLIVEQPNPAAEVTFREAAPPLRVFHDPSAAWKKALFAYQQPLIVSLALAESVALYGLVLVSLGFPRPTVVPFLVVCWVLQIARFPTDAKLAAAVKAATGVELPLGT